MKRLLTFLLCLGCASSVYAQKETLMPVTRQTVLNSAGQLVNGACIWTYLAGTTTQTNTYTDQTGNTPNSNPIIATNGVFVAYLTPGVSYKFTYESTPCNGGLHGAVIYTQDNVAAVPTTASNVAIIGTAAQTLSPGTCAYLSDGSGARTSGQFYPCDQGNPYSSTTIPIVGLVAAQILSGTTGSITLDGYVTGLASLSVGSTYYAGTAGALTSTAPANARRLGQADTATSLVVKPDSPPVIPLSATNGQIPIGNGSGYTVATLTQGEGVQVTNAAGAITLANGVLDHKTATTTINNSASETTLYSFSVPGGTLSTNRVIHFSATGSVLQNSGSPQTYTIRAKYGATTFAGIAVLNIPSANATGPLNLDCEVMATGATNSQAAKCRLEVAYNSGNFNGSGTAGADMSATNITQVIVLVPSVHVSMAIDSTTAQTLVVTGQMSAANASMTITMNSAYTEVK